MKRYMAIFILGIIVGSVAVNIYLGRQIEQIYWEKEELRVRLFETGERLKKLENQLATHRNPVIKEVRIELEVEKNSFVQLSLRKELTKITNELIGEEIDTVSPFLIQRLLDDRQIQLEDENVTYKIKLNWIILSETTIIHAEAEEINN